MQRFTPVLAGLIAAGLAPAVQAARPGSDYRAEVLSLNPIGYWEFEGTGAPVDSTGNGHHAAGTVSGVLTGQAGAFPDLGYSYTMPGGLGSTYTVDNTGGNKLDTGAFSVSAWFSPGTWGNTVITKGNLSRSGGTLHAWDLFTVASGGDAYLRFKGSNGVNNNWLWNFDAPLGPTAGIPSAAWFNVVAAWDGTTNANGVSVYVNGDLRGQATATATNLATNFDLRLGGVTPSGTSWTWDGGLDDIALFDYALTGAQVGELYNSAAPQPATISFTGEDFLNVSQLSTVGDLVEARNFGGGTAVTLNGITFTAAGASGDHLSVQSGNTFGHGDIYRHHIHDITGLSDADGNALLDGKVFGSGAGSSLVTLSGLTVGEPYLFQFLNVDDRSGTPEGGFIRADEAAPGTNTTGWLDHTQNHVQLTTGIFTATSPTQTLHMRTSWAENAQINAYQLRHIPEPATWLLLLSALACGLLVRRRKQEFV